MRTKSVRLMIVMASMVGMASCVHIWTAGPPCVGNACPTGAGGALPGVSGQEAEKPSARAARPTEVATAQMAGEEQASAAQASSSASSDAQASAQAPTRASDANAAPAADAQANNAQASEAQANSAQPNPQEKPGKFTRLLRALHLHSKS